ncbi:CD63 antigen-like [Episyrphus balteatus]|uniref:CD63 antigen-like n=1 Tax=Episyrphus balteatus TaxID=286459 RepID=UPI0024858391|nr:CD63 antigen-like [Episyrphus balteatus]
MNCLAHIIKYILFVCNLVFLICGVLLIVFGSLAISSLKEFLTFTEANSTSFLPICILILGCIIFLVSFLGCCGAIKDSRCLVNSYCICMLILLILQIAVIVYAWFFKSTLLDNMGEVVDHAWQIHDSQPGFMDSLQLSYKCCGYQNGSIDYTGNGQSIPPSCCGSLTAVCDPIHAATMPGCKTQFLDFWGSNTNIIKYAGLAVAGVECIALILGWFLSSSIKVSQKDNRTH